MATALASGATTSLVPLDPLERRVIMYLRLLRNGRRGWAEVEQDIGARVGSGSQQALEHIERLEELMCHTISRPLDIGSVDDVQATRSSRQRTVRQRIVVSFRTAIRQRRARASTSGARPNLRLGSLRREPRRAAVAAERVPITTSAPEQQHARPTGRSAELGPRQRDQEVRRPVSTGLAPPFQPTLHPQNVVWSAAK